VCYITHITCQLAAISVDRSLRRLLRGNILNLNWPSRSEGVLGFHSVALIIQTPGSYRYCFNDVCDHNEDHCAYDFLAHHATPWSADDPRYWVSILNSKQHDVQAHMRSFVVEMDSTSLTGVPTGLGIRCGRESGTLSFIGEAFDSPKDVIPCLRT
jgi:hypothetical protein